jgi:hypothetical protein
MVIDGKESRLPHVTLVCFWIFITYDSGGEWLTFLIEHKSYFLICWVSLTPIQPFKVAKMHLPLT